MECERCHSKSEGYNLFDYCAVCSANLCPHCMAEGCCGNVPAESGSEADNGEEFDAAEPSVVRTNDPLRCTCFQWEDDEECPVHGI